MKSLTPTAHEREIVERAMSGETPVPRPSPMSRFAEENEARRLVLENPNSDPTVLRASLQSACDDIDRMLKLLDLADVSLEYVHRLATE